MNTGEDDFSFTLEDIERIINLNDKLKKEEARIRHFPKDLNLTLKKQVAEKEIDDYNIRTRFCVFSSNVACNLRHQVEEGEPTWEDKSYTMYRDDQDVEFYTDNWNELPATHPLGHLLFCYTMHCLVFHSELSWWDIVEINDVWIELKVDYQFFVSGNKETK